MKKAIIFVSILLFTGCQNQSEEKYKKELVRITDSLNNAHEIEKKQADDSRKKEAEIKEQEQEKRNREIDDCNKKISELNSDLTQQRGSRSCDKNSIIGHFQIGWLTNDNWEAMTIQYKDISEIKTASSGDDIIVVMVLAYGKWIILAQYGYLYQSGGGGKFTPESVQWANDQCKKVEQLVKDIVNFKANKTI